MEKQLEEKNTEMGSVITRSEEFIQKNQKTLIIGICAVIVIVLAIFGLRRWYFQPRETRAADEMFAAEQWFDQGEYQKALDGDETYRGFLSVIDGFGSTKSGNLAKYYAGICNLQLGNFDEAIHWLKKYKGHDAFTRSLAEMGLADAYMEKGETKTAAGLYVSAAGKDPNFVTTPSALFKAGIAYLALGDNAKALDCFQKVKANYPESTEWSDIDKYIAIADPTAE